MSFVCSVDGQVVAVRLAVHSETQRGAQLEAAEYKRLKPLQGRHVPRLIADRYTCAGSVSFVATEYVKVVIVKRLIPHAHKSTSRKLLSLSARKSAMLGQHYLC